MVKSSIVYWISQNLAQSPLMYYNIQYGIRFIKKKIYIYQCKDRDPNISAKEMWPGFTITSHKKTVSTSLKIGKTSDKPQSNSKSQYLGLHILSYHIISYQYESFSDVGEIRVFFASKILTPCRMHWNAFLIAQIIAKCHSFPNM